MVVAITDALAAVAFGQDSNAFQGRPSGLLGLLRSGESAGSAEGKREKRQRTLLCG